MRGSNEDPLTLFLVKKEEKPEEGRQAGGLCDAKGCP